VEGVHRDEEAAVLVERQANFFYYDSWSFFVLGVREGDDELGDDREHVDLESVELIEADPGAVSS